MRWAGPAVVDGSWRAWDPISREGTTYMEPILTGPRRRLLTTIFERGAEEASGALSKWLGQPVRVTVNDVDEVEMAEASELLGPAEELVAACLMGLGGGLTGQLLLVFQDRSGLALADLLLRYPVGTSTAWGELEQSAAMETANIVGCAYLNSLAAHLPLPADRTGAGSTASIVPSPPTFRHEFAGSLLEFTLMEQAVELDRLLLVQSRFDSDRMGLNWSLLLVPSVESLDSLSMAMAELETR
jgi:chemotaxis protein CheC